MPLFSHCVRPCWTEEEKRRMMAGAQETFRSLPFCCLVLPHRRLRRRRRRRLQSISSPRHLFPDHLWRAGNEPLTHLATKKTLSEDDWRFDLISAVTSSNAVDTRRALDADTRSISGQYTRTEMKRRRSRSRSETHVSYHPRSLPVSSIRYCYEFVSLSLHKSRRKEIVIMSAIIFCLGSAHSKCTRLVLFSIRIATIGRLSLPPRQLVQWTLAKF